MDNVQQQHDYEAARGGFWIMPDGTSAPVRYECEHISTLRSLRHDDVTYYDEAYARGWVRVAFYANDYNFGIDYRDDSVTVPALRALASIIRHYGKALPHLTTYRFEPRQEGAGWDELRRDNPVDYWDAAQADPRFGARIFRAHDRDTEKTASRAASHAIRMALERMVAAKQSERVLEAA